MRSVRCIVLALHSTDSFLPFWQAISRRTTLMVALCCLQSWQWHSKIDHTFFYRSKKANSEKQSRWKKVFLFIPQSCLRGRYILSCRLHPGLVTGICSHLAYLEIKTWGQVGNLAWICDLGLHWACFVPEYVRWLHVIWESWRISLILRHKIHMGIIP